MEKKKKGKKKNLFVPIIDDSHISHGDMTYKVLPFYLTITASLTITAWLAMVLNMILEMDRVE